MRFGASDGDGPPRKDVKRLQALPSNDEPGADLPGRARRQEDRGVHGRLGRRRPGRRHLQAVAHHLRDHPASARARPSSSTCPTRTARQRPTVGPQYELDLVKIRKTTTTDAKKAKTARARVSPKGRMILRARIAGDGPLRYRYDAKTGRLQKLSTKAYKAVVAKAARAARAHF